MQPYQAANGDAGVVAYQESPGGITVQFRDGSVYLYNKASAGPSAIGAMKRLAASGRGLTTYINKHVRQNFAAKLR